MNYDSIYNFSLDACNAAWNKDVSKTRDASKKIYTNGIESPSVTNLIQHKASQKFLNSKQQEMENLTFGEIKMLFKIKKAINIFRKADSNSEEKHLFMEKVKKLYPSTALVRQVLINSNRLSLDFTTPKASFEIKNDILKKLNMILSQEQKNNILKLLKK